MLKKLISLFSIMIAISTSCLADAPVLKLNDFAFGAMLTPAEPKLRRFTLSPAMLDGIKRTDLGDIRIFDGNNKLMPSLVRKKDGDIKISRQLLTFKREQAGDIITGYILDRDKNLEQPLKSLYLKWKKGTAPNIMTIHVEHSADKSNWKTLIKSVTVNNFKFSGQWLNQNGIDINDYTERYIKLTFLDKKRAPTLSSVSAYTTSKKISDYIWIPAGKLQTYKGSPGTYQFIISSGIPPKLLKLSFVNLNSILSGSLDTLSIVNGKTQRKTVLENFKAYAVSLNNKIAKARPVDISKWPSQRWLINVKASKNIQLNDLPGATIAFQQHEAIFIADGIEPYTVVWNNIDAGKPASGSLADNIKANVNNIEDITEVEPGGLLNNAELTELLESRQTPWLLILTLLFIAVIVGILFKPVLRKFTDH